MHKQLIILNRLVSSDPIKKSSNNRENSTGEMWFIFFFEEPELCLFFFFRNYHLYCGTVRTNLI